MVGMLIIRGLPQSIDTLEEFIKKLCDKQSQYADNAKMYWLHIQYRYNPLLSLFANVPMP